MTESRSGPRPAPVGALRRERRRSNAVLVYTLLLVALQIFLLTVAVEGLLGGEDHLARAAAGLSVLLFVITLGFARLLRHD
jgi:hypothetical protein